MHRAGGLPRSPQGGPHGAKLLHAIKVAFLSIQASPAFVDIVNGLTKYIKTVLEPKGLATVVATEWVDIQPVDVDSPMKKIVDAKADVIMGTANTTLAGAAIRSEQLHGVNIPTIASPWHTIWPDDR